MELTVTNMQRRLLFFFILGLLLLCCTPIESFAQESKSPTRVDLEKVVSQSTLEITTTGRTSGKPHTKPIWFVYDQGRLYLQAGKEGKTDWYQNLTKNPQLTLKIGELTVSGKAKFIKDEKEAEHIHGL